MIVNASAPVLYRLQNVTLIKSISGLLLPEGPGFILVLCQLADFSPACNQDQSGPPRALAEISTVGLVRFAKYPKI
jgi:hypothetical protein